MPPNAPEAIVQSRWSIMEKMEWAGRETDERAARSETSDS